MKTATKRKRWLLYILSCRDDSLYIGITNDLPRRLTQHQAGTASRYTRGRRPVAIIHQEPCPGRSAALKKEFSLKQLTRKAKEEYIQAQGQRNSGASS